MPHSYRFGNAELLPVERQLLVDGRLTGLGSRAFDVLLTLVERRDRLVTKNELLEVAWPGLVVEENNLAAQVSALRKLLGAGVVATIPGLGYRFCAAIAGDVPRPGAAPESRTEPFTNLPAPTESLIGREAELAALGAMLQEHRLVTVVGPGGIGKTRLAQELGRSRRTRFPDGAWWVDLAAVPGKELVVPAIANAAGLRPGRGEAAEELARAIGGRRMLLLLDNCEHIAEDAAQIVRTLLAGAPALTVLATSQEPLKVPGEFAYALDGLFVAGEDDPPEAARACAAVRLLDRRALSVDARHRLPDSKLPLALELCRRLDGMALAIEMAAARIPLMGIESLLERIGERLELLRSSDRGAAARYRTMRATLEWSFSLLSPGEKSVLARLSAFVGSFRLDAAQRVASAGDLDEWEVLDCLSALVDKSLLRVEPADPPRYRLLETLRLFGLEQLAALGESESAVRDHALAMTAIAEEVLQAFDLEAEEACVRRHAPDYDDLLAVWSRGCERRDPDLASRTVMAVATLDVARGIYQPRWLDKSLAHELAVRAEPLARARLWYCIALMKYTPGVSNVDAARAHVAAWREVGDERRLFEALGDLAEFLAAAGRVDDAEDALAEMRRLVQPEWTAQMRLAYHWPATAAAAFGGDMALLGARLDDQERAAAAAASLRRAVVSSWQRVAWAVGAGDLAHALQLGPIAIRKAEEYGNPSAIAAARLSHATALLLSGSLPEVPALLRDCLDISRRKGFMGGVLDAFALYAAKTGQAGLSARLLGSADACYARIVQVRGPLESRAASAVLANATLRLDVHEFARLRAVGSDAPQSDALALAEALAGASSAEQTRGGPSGAQKPSGVEVG